MWTGQPVGTERFLSEAFLFVRRRELQDAVKAEGRISSHRSCEGEVVGGCSCGSFPSCIQHTTALTIRQLVIPKLCFLLFCAYFLSNPLTHKTPHELNIFLILNRTPKVGSLKTLSHVVRILPRFFFGGIVCFCCFGMCLSDQMRVLSIKPPPYSIPHTASTFDRNYQSSHFFLLF